MASLAHVIRDYQNGGLTRDEFIARLDNTLTTDSLSPARMMNVLDEAHARSPLPADLHAEVRRRIEQLPVSNLAAGGEETRLQTRVDAPSLASSGMSTPGPLPGHDQIKGTGDTLNNRFVLEECLGVGGMGTVYKALDLRKLEASDRKPYLAIKVLNVQFRGNPKSLIALQREARKAQVLAHRNIVTVYDFDRDGAIVYLTMEYLSGRALSQILRTEDFHGMPVRAALPIVRGMCGALAYAHERGFVHCDFKPANVFLTDTGEVKVIDFGIARVFQRPEEESDATVFDPGTLGALTPAYASPEMLEHREPDPRDDIYALGCITYELLTGHHPFDRQSATQARSTGRKPERPPNLDARQWRALRSALSFDRNTRMPTVARFVEEFGAEEKVAAKSATRVKVGIAAGVAVLVAAGVGVGVYRASSGGHGEAVTSGDVASSAAVGASAPVATEASTASAASVVQAAPPPAPAPVAPPAPAPKPALSMAAVTPVLARVACSALAPSVDGHTLHVQGFVPQHYGVTQLKSTLGAVPGVDALNLDVQTIADDRCDEMKSFAPYWVSNLQGGHATALHVRPASGQLTEGDPLVVDITTPGYDSYVNLDYYQLDGSVVHMVPGPRAKDNQAPPHYAATIGGGGDWVIAKPFGSELVVLMVTPVPLFDRMRPESESRADYLHALDARLAQIAGKYGRERIGVDIAQITTKARAH
ncbi:serine/threonine protein kinase [Paraburkholderia saeva]|uniref:Serine/threonine-protein kinase PknD n=1 Tax=Paraburkholderia saeva TaxID=2777537 RepID=A0A9N8RVI0_9BURK|nr:serine/threonine protein kinase [Paraburkholderia saeva]CAG4897417.1 Serine/threonine-protein kinase PknD [Paraburkholderia saeva]CAG4919782.1 Serine/threonine-protein kinase PknD [Paraburkholderia saeva]